MQSFYSKSFAKFLFLILLTTIISAQERNTVTHDTLTYQNPFEINVTGTRVNTLVRNNSTATTIIGQDILHNMYRTIAVDEALKYVPGVRIDNQANGSRVHMSIRGQGILSEHGLRGIKVILDGVPLNDPTGFASDLYDIDWLTVEKIEVLRGPTASLYGGGSNAGVLNIITKSGSIKNSGVDISSSFGSNEFWKAFAQLNGAASNVDYRFSVSRTMGDGYRMHSGFQANNVYGKINWQPTEKLQLIQIVGWTYYYNENAEGLNIDQVNKDLRLPNDDAIPMNEFQETNRVFGGVVGNYKINDLQDLSFNAYLRSTNYKEPGSKYIWHRKLFTPGITLQYNLQHTLGSFTNRVSIGSDIEQQNIDEYTVQNMKSAIDGSTFTSNENIQQTGIGLYLIDRVDINQQWSFILSLRYDKIKNSLFDFLKNPVDLSDEANYENTTCRLGINYSPSSSINLYANWGQGFLPPATEELSSNPENPGGFNKSLVPATSQSEEIGIRGLISEKLYYDISIFYLTTKNDFDRYRILPQRPLETFYRNYGSSRRYGLESFITWSPTQSLFFKCTYTYSNFKYSEPSIIKDNWLPNSPEHQLVLECEYKINEKISFSVSDEMQSKWYIYTDRDDIWQDGFNIASIRGTYNMKMNGAECEIFMYVRNLFDNSYIAFTEPDPDGNSYQPGPKREIFGGIKIHL
jgi:iron complex outermembrane recepter protein